MQKTWKKKYKVDFKGLNTTGFKEYPYVRDAANFLRPIIGVAEIIDDSNIEITFKEEFPKEDYQVLNLVSEIKTEKETIKVLLGLLVEKKAK